MRFFDQEDVSDFGNVVFKYIRTSLSGHVFTLTLNRPEKRNAFTPLMATEIAFALAFAHYEPEVRVVVLNAEGPVFCAGADLQAFYETESEKSAIPASKDEVRLGDAFLDLAKPCIAQVEGPVLAGGFLLICGCTFVIAVAEASFGLPEVKRGIWPMQVMASLNGIVSQRKLLEMAITGRNYTAEEALQMGLITSVSPKNSIADDVQKLASTICRNAPLAIKGGINAFRKMQEVPTAAQHLFLKKELNELLKTEDAREGSLAFKEKREPVWKGR